MIPYILTAVGGYLIGSSLKTKFANGGNIDGNNGNAEMLESNAKAISHHSKELQNGGKMEEGGITGDVHSMTDKLLSQKIQIFIDKVMPIKYYYIDEKSNSLVVGLDENYTQDAADRFYKEATSSIEFFDADSIDMEYNSKTKDTQYIIKLKKPVKFKNGGKIANTILSQLGGARRLNIMTGAYNFVDVGYGLSFRLKNPRANYVKIKLNPMDLYDIEVGRIRGNTYKIIDTAENIYFEKVKPFIEKATGLYLSLKNGGYVDNRTVLYDGFTAKTSMGVKELEKLNQRFIDAQLVKQSKHLREAINELKSGNEEAAKSEMKKFNSDAMDWLPEEYMIERYKTMRYENGGEVKYQIKRNDGKYLSIGMDGKIKWYDSPDMGYMYKKEDAEYFSEYLNNNGNQVEVTQYNKNWWKN